MTKAKQRVKNAGCASCDYYEKQDIFSFGGISRVVDGYCKYETGKMETAYESIGGKVECEQRLQCDVANKDCECQHFSDEKKKAAIEREKIAEVVRDEMKRADGLEIMSVPLWSTREKLDSTLKRIDRIEKRLMLDVAFGMIAGLATIALYVLVLT